VSTIRLRGNSTRKGVGWSQYSRVEGASSETRVNVQARRSSTAPRSYLNLTDKRGYPHQQRNMGKDNDELEEINGVKPKVYMRDGDENEVAGSG
jgi:hypothetical protein